MQHASCLFNNCDACSIRNIWQSSDTHYSCDGGFDTEGVYTSPCLPCTLRTIPATQDYEAQELSSMLDPTSHDQNQEEAFDVTDDVMFDAFLMEEDLGDVLFGAENRPLDVQQVFNDLKAWQDQRWPPCSLPYKSGDINTKDGERISARYYRLFNKPILPEEEQDFKEFLGLIF